LVHFCVFGRRMIKMDRKMMWKMMWKMATVNALKCKHPENEVKMHFTYLWQCSADSNSPSKDLNKIISPGYPATDLIGILSSLLESWDYIVNSFVLLTTWNKLQQ
jgi:hypothetical protein